MFEGLAVKDLIDFGGWGVMAALVAFDLLVPRRSHIRQLDEARADRDAWRALAEKLMASSDATVKLLEDIKREATKR